MFHYIRLFVTNRKLIVAEVNNGMTCGISITFSEFVSRSTLDDYANAFQFSCEMADERQIPVAIDPSVILWKKTMEAKS